MKTRQDYLKRECTHREYYAQFVTDSIKNIVASRFGVERLKNALLEDEHLNSIKLIEWDMLHISVDMSDYGDRLTLAGKNCILKEAARQLCEENK